MKAPSVLATLATVEKITSFESEIRYPRSISPEPLQVSRAVTSIGEYVATMHPM